MFAAAGDFSRSRKAFASRRLYRRALRGGGMSQPDLPGVPVPPKKRGRPSAGGAKSPAERKASQRAALAALAGSGSESDILRWLEGASVSALLESFPVFLAARPAFAVHVADRLAVLARSGVRAV